jgi:hypothetical protein
VLCINDTIKYKQGETMYAFIVKNNANTWDVWSTLLNIPFVDRKERVESALASGFPITGQNLTEHKESVKNGAIWDGAQWSGGDSMSVSQEMALNLFAYICNDTIILIHISSPNSASDIQMAAIFESENSMIKVPEGQTAKIGDIWDGENIINI